MTFPFRFLTFLASIVFASVALADTESRTNGSDLFIAGVRAGPSIDAPGDLFAAGRSLVLNGRAAADVHAAGFSVDVETSVGADLYAAGAHVTVRADVGGDMTLAGFDVRSTKSAKSAGNARVMGGTVTLMGPVEGALAVMGSDILLDAPVGGDVLLTGDNISFGDAAKIAGRLHYASSEPIEIPSNVIPASRVTFEEREAWQFDHDRWRDWDDMPEFARPSAPAMLAGLLITIGFMVLVGMLFLSWIPDEVERARRHVVERPGMSSLAGLFGLSALIGLIPISIMTIVGIPLAPAVALLIIVLWTLGYMLGAYAVAYRVFEAFGMDVADAGNIRKLAILAAGVFVGAIFNFIPVIGWIVNFALVLLGGGAIVKLLFHRFYNRAEPGPSEAEKAETEK